MAQSAKFEETPFKHNPSAAKTIKTWLSAARAFSLRKTTSRYAANSRLKTDGGNWWAAQAEPRTPQL